MNILYFTETDRGIDRWREEFAKVDPSLKIFGLDDKYDPASIEVVLAWKPPVGVFPQLTNLKLIHSLGMGVDHIFACSDRPTNIPIARIIDEDMSVQMAEYVLYGVLTAFRNFHLYAQEQQSSTWKTHPRHFHDEFKIGIMGYGELGQSVTQCLQKNGFPNIRIWANSKREIAGIECFNGKDQLPAFATDLDVLVCLLPLTDSTKLILNQSLFEKMKPGAYLINPARGDHLQEQDLLDAIESGSLSGALLDVFTKEPMPSDHPFWQTKGITITPHVAASTNPRTASNQVIENLQRTQQNLPAHNLIDLQKAY